MLALLLSPNWREKKRKKEKKIWNDSIDGS
jgi:hypothetical protein